MFDYLGLCSMTSVIRGVYSLQNALPRGRSLQAADRRMIRGHSTWRPVDRSPFAPCTGDSLAAHAASSSSEAMNAARCGR